MGAPSAVSPLALTVAVPHPQSGHPPGASSWDNVAEYTATLR